jgi:hypothetical protein
MTTDNFYGIDLAELPSKLLADITRLIDYAEPDPGRPCGTAARLRRFITSVPPECGWRPEGVTQAADTLRAYGASTSADHLLVKVRCTLPAGHHEYVEVLNSMYDPCCDVSSNDPIHCGDEHRIEGTA